ncbi:MAG: COP23 domain-containing protein [Oscillatoria sp. PMC 1068.18]|nr:COP23 domain-containing protein [Oscillatoria sp. PMC 1068.18]
MTALGLSATGCETKQIRNIAFFCGASRDGIPTTLASTSQGDTAVIRWVSDYFSSSGYDPEKRCNQVSERFQTYYQLGILNYITTGIIERQEVICVSSIYGGPCDGVLFTLEPGESASRVIQGLFDIGKFGLNPLKQSSGEDQIYIDFHKFLETAPREINEVKTLRKSFLKQRQSVKIFPTRNFIPEVGNQ